VDSKFSTSKMVLLTLVAPMLVAVPQQTFAQDAIEEIITTGTRSKARSVEESPAPIDVLSGDFFSNQGDTDLSNLIRNIVPSYNVNMQPISDAATIVRPANLRGLAPDHTLLLINGKRRHRAAVINWLGNGVSNGSQGPDVATIPAIALKQVEILRDGAAAQYGSDAIAGVLNFILKDDSEGGSIEVKYGQYQEGDGDQYSVSGNIGLPLTDAGFANFSFEYGETDATDRSVQRDDAAALIAAGNTLTRHRSGAHRKLPMTSNCGPTLVWILGMAWTYTLTVTSYPNPSTAASTFVIQQTAALSLPANWLMLQQVLLIRSTALPPSG